MTRAIWQGVVIAQSDQVVEVEGNHYFPPEAVHRAFLRESANHTVCGWKGTANYFDVVVAGKVNQDAAWYYPAAQPAARHIEGFVAFWRGVEILP